MQIHYLQHVNFEGPGIILNWVKQKKHNISSTKFYLNESLPDISSFDFLIIMGGPMNIYDERTFPYLSEEKLFIKEAIKKGIPVLGICLGAQLIADVLGAKIKKNKEKEIGWFPISTTKNSYDNELKKIITTNNPVFHWHGDTFEIPNGAIRLAENNVCENQAFLYNTNVFALQYHLEVTKNSLQQLIKNSSHELTDAPFIQTPEEMLKDQSRFDYINKKLFALLDYITKDY